MTKNSLNDIEKFLNDNDNIEKAIAIKKIVEKFGLKKNAAESFYNNWRESYAVSSNTTEDKKETKPVKKNKLQIVSAKIKGQFGSYELKEDGSVRVGEETFKTAEDVDAYKSREIALFMARLGEILDVMQMGVVSND